MKLSFVLIFLFILSFACNGYTQQSWSFLNTERIGAAQFLKKYPDTNGKNVTIFILDSGLDVATPGLRYLPDGEIKIIDVADFSGEGDVYLDPAEKGKENDEAFLQTLDGLKLFGYDKLDIQAMDSTYYIGSLDEYKFRNNKVKDINANGKTDDRFGIILFQIKENEWIAYVDLDGDGNLTDEKPVKDYAIDHQPLYLRGFEKKYDYQPLNFALKIYPDEKRVNFHFDASSHGTHVAGIAAGFKINGQSSLNGIAPGAKLISLKIGNSRYSGASTTTGAMRDAFDYIVDYASSSDDAVIVNMSYGIGSENEGLADMEYYINDILQENKNIVLCLSGGNKGPGLSSIGLPAAAANAITVGALNDVETARDIYGGNIKSDKIYNFSSRGGEVPKPDLVAPGAASSTVPPFTSSETKRGTSMASPQASGAVALLFSAAKKDFPGKQIPGYKIKKALMNSARPLKGYTLPDQGAGVINLPQAYEYLKNYLLKGEIVIGYEINTVSPFYETEYGSAAFWRYGTYFPTKREKQTVYINPVFDKKISAEQKNKFYKAFALSSSAEWLKTVQSNVYLKGSAPAEIQIYLDQKKLEKPGLYSAQIIGYEKSGIFSSNTNENIEFRVWCTVVIPYFADQFEENIKYFKNNNLAPGDIKREFVQISPLNTAFSIQLKQNSSDYAYIQTTVSDPFGKEVTPSALLNSQITDERIINISAELVPGTWEIDFYAPFTNSETSNFDYDFGVSMLHVYDDIIHDFKVKNDDTPTASFKAVNNAKKAVKLRISGGVMGIQRVVNISKAYASYEHSFYVGDLYRGVEFEIELNKEIYVKLTDFTINIKDISGKILSTTALGYKSKR